MLLINKNSTLQALLALRMIHYKILGLASGNDVKSQYSISLYLIWQLYGLLLSEVLYSSIFLVLLLCVLFVIARTCGVLNQ